MKQARSDTKAHFLEFQWSGVKWRFPIIRQMHDAVAAAIGNAVGVMSTMRRATLIGAGFMFCGALFTSMAGNVMTIILSLGFLSGEYQL
jgi:hypothetical protein